MTTAVEVDGTQVDSYQRLEKVEFLPDVAYTSMSGIITFRGSNYRDSAAYGAASVSQMKAIGGYGQIETGELPRSDVGGTRPNKPGPEAAGSASP